MESRITRQQMKALHKWFSMLADDLNEMGLDQRVVLKPSIDIPWSGQSIKEMIFRPIMNAQLDKSSTTELSTKDVDKLLNTITRHLGERFGIETQFPSIDQLIQDKYVQEEPHS